MGDGEFQFEDCVLKHYVRHDVWLPRCKNRLKEIRSAAGRSKKAQPRRLKYFTFCAVGALDVLLLDREKVIRRSAEKEFDTVYFFDRDEEAVLETRKRIPGAIGFPGDFVQVVLEAGQGIGLASPEHAENTRVVREHQMKRAQHERFVYAFPFDVINLDVEQYLYRPKEQLPGKLTSAIRQIFEWQKRQGDLPGKKRYVVNEFTLMFTTKVGPENLPDDYLQYLRDTCLQQNLHAHPELQEPFAMRSHGQNVVEFFSSSFASAFKLSVPKSLAELALEADWYIDGDQGIQVCQFDRPSKDGPYTMLHMAMTVRRQEPPKDRRAPGQGLPAIALTNHKSAILQLFQTAPVGVEAMVVGDRKDQLEADLKDLFEYRKRYYVPPKELT